MTDFSKPQEISDVLKAFPADVQHLMPEYKDVPQEFKDPFNPFVKWQNEWFFCGLACNPVPKPGIDIVLAMRHLGAIQGSFQPKHQHKQAAVAYLG